MQLAMLVSHQGKICAQTKTLILFAVSNLTQNRHKMDLRQSSMTTHWPKVNTDYNSLNYWYMLKILRLAGTIVLKIILCRGLKGTLE